MSRRQFAVLALAALVVVGSAARGAAEDQAAAEPTFLQRLAQYVRLREGMDAKGVLLARPAQLLLTRPAKGDTAVAADLAVVGVYELPLRAIDGALELGPAIEYHRNTAPKKEQDTLKVGGTFSSILGDIAEDGMLPAHMVQLAPAYFRDAEKDTESFLLTADYVPIFNFSLFPVGRIRGIFGGKPKSEDWDWRYLRARWLPTLGFEYQRVFSTETPSAAGARKAPTGHETRAYWQIALGLYPLGEL